MYPEALILRRCYPVPVTFADLRAAHGQLIYAVCPEHGPIWTVDEDGCCSSCGGDAMEHLRTRWNAALKQATGALDEINAVVDGREVRVAVLKGSMGVFKATGPIWIGMGRTICDLAEVADQQGYWERPHEVRLELQRRES